MLRQKQRVRFSFLLLVLLYSCILFVHSQIILETQVENSAPFFTNIQTYSRYGNVSDNFPLDNFSICIGETNRTIQIEFIAKDRNNNVEIHNVTWKLLSVINGTETIVPSFGNSFKEATLDSNVSSTELSYLANITLTNDGNKTLYKVIANVTDVHNASFVNISYFTLYKTDCLRIEKNASLVTTGPYTLVVNYTELEIFVTENVTGRIIVELHEESPVDSNVPSALDKYITIDVEGIVLQKTVNLSLLVEYLQQEVEEKGLDENSLRIYKFGSWNLQDGVVNVSENEVSFSANHTLISGNYSYRLGTYSIRGTLAGQSPTIVEESAPEESPTQRRSGFLGDSDAKNSGGEASSRRYSSLSPGQLFNVLFMLEERIIPSSDKLRGIVVFEPSKNISALVNLTFIVSDKKETELYREKTNFTVMKRDVLSWNYSGLQELSDGSYTAILHTQHGSLFDEYIQPFEVRKDHNWLNWGYFTAKVLFLVWPLFIFLLCIRKRKNKKN